MNKLIKALERKNEQTNEKREKRILENKNNTFWMGNRISVQVREDVFNQYQKSLTGINKSTLKFASQFISIMSEE